MLEYIHLKNVGPAAEMKMDLAPRLNVLTGDNGLGKSFLLDIAWWSLTRLWPKEVNPKLASGLMARPQKDGAATISFAIDGKAKPKMYESTFDYAKQAWTGRSERPTNPGLVLYAMADGSFAVWDPARDPARNYLQEKNNDNWQKQIKYTWQELSSRPRAYVFTPQQVWDGLKGEKGMLCNGLIADWAGWQKEKGETFKNLRAVLEELSPGEREKIIPGELTRISMDDVRDMPTIRMEYGQDIPILHASAGMRRILALAYFLVWCWQEHKQASLLLRQETTNKIVFLIDEMEAHLHPRWQRSIVRALLKVVEKLIPTASVQLIGATHSPLVLASVEPLFDEKQDAWFDIDLIKETNKSRVVLEKREWIRQGDAARWLTSEAFDLGSARSLEAEQALKEAEEALKDEGFNSAKAKAIDAKLRKVLGDTDPFWMRWRFVGEKRGWLK